MKNKGINKKYTKKAKKLLSIFLQVNTTLPATKLITENDDISYKLGDILVTVEISQDLLDKIGYKLNKQRIHNINENEKKRIETIIKANIKGNKLNANDLAFIKNLKSKTCSKSCLLAYLYKEIYWIIISILCSSYISSYILMRSIIELLINISTTQNGGVSNKINGIPFLDQKEKKSFKKLWDELCSWSHPYNKWTKNICSRYISHYPPIYHPRIADNCIKMMYQILDIYLVICNEYFQMDTTVFSENEGPINTSNYPLFKKRISNAISSTKNINKPNKPIQRTADSRR